MRSVRRILAILLMFLVPLQFAWSAAQGLHGHLDSELSATGFHSHDSDHGHADSDAPSVHDAAVDDGGAGAGEHEHSAGHYHPIMVSIVVDADLKIGPAPLGGSPPSSAVHFSSRVPPPFDWPPSARS